MQVDDIARQRFESFKLGMPSTSAQVAPGHRHGRSHSRNASISSTISLPTLVSTTTHEITPTQSLPPPPKRNSHHRRRSSVSTRRESAEMMGVSVDSASSPAEDPAERDSLRRNALWALEGKRDQSFSKVEIPELPAPFEFPTKPSFPPGSGTFTAKRDSFKPSSKDCLHTLVEEEEEEEDSGRPRAPPTPTTPTTSVFMRNITARPRPPHLRPLSLTPDSLPTQNLPTPSSPKRSSLKVLALAPDATIPSSAPIRPRPVLNLKLSPDAPSPSSAESEEIAARPKPLRKSSISYKISSNAAGLPTPETTPTCSERRFSSYSHASISSTGSTSSSNRLDDDLISAGSRPLSASEQHFLFKSHNALLARITDLERALSFRNSNVRERGSRPSSFASALSVASRSSSPEREEPIDEMVSLVADLKAERDELKRDVDGWRTRVADLEKQLTVFTNRVEVERREAWVARTQVGLLEVERTGLAKRVGELQSENDRLLQGEEDLRQYIAQLLEEKETLAIELRDAKNNAYREADPLGTPRAFDGPVVSMRPVALSMKRGLGFTSLDSESSATDVEDGSLQSLNVGFKLHAVEEEVCEDNGLAGYEDEDDNDVLLSPSSSFGSVEDFYPSRTSGDMPTDTTPQPTAAAPSHVNRLSISKWTFPKSITSTVEASEPEVDRFFGCLDDLDDPPSPDCPNYSDYDEEKSKGLFAKGFSFGDAKSCFVLPASVLASAETSFILDSVEEEEGDETEAETVVEDGEVNNGIKITFTPPMEDTSSQSSLLGSSPSPRSTSASTVASFEDQEEADEEFPKPVFSFGRARETPLTPPSRHESPSSIPRPISRTPSSPTSPPPLRSVSPLNSFVTPPTKRGGALPSFIPQPSSPSRNNTQISPPSFSTNASTKPSTTFIRQPPRQPLMPSKTNGSAIPKPRLSSATTPHDCPRYTDDSAPRPGPDMKSVDLLDRNIPMAASSSSSPSTLASSSFSSIMSSPLGRLSSLTSYIPSWGMTSPRSAQSDVVGYDSRPVGAPAGPVKRGFVSKQSQLERLKSRLERETREGGRSAVGKKCDDEAIFL